MAISRRVCGLVRGGARRVLDDRLVSLVCADPAAKTGGTQADQERYRPVDDHTRRGRVSYVTAKGRGRADNARGLARVSPQDAAAEVRRARRRGSARAASVPRRCCRCTVWSGTWPRSSGTGSAGCWLTRAESTAIYCTTRPDDDFERPRRRRLGGRPRDLAGRVRRQPHGPRRRAGSTTPASRRGEPCSLRWIYVHMIEEYARHNGHADLIRELIDGETGD